MRKVYLLTCFIFTVFTSYAQSDIYESYAIINKNGTGNTYYDLFASTGNSDFNGANLGSFIIGSNTLVLNGAQNKVYKCGTDNITNGNFWYRIYKTAATPGSFTSSTIFFSFDNGAALCGGINQVWESSGANINVLSGLTAGTYYLEMYTTADFTYSTGSGTHTANNGAANYKATFTVANPTGVISGNSSICSGQSANLTINLTGTAPWNITLSNGSVFNGVASSPYTATVSPVSTTTYTITSLTDANGSAQAADLTGSATVTVTTTSSNFSGSYTIPSPCYPTISSFVTAINAGTVTGPVTVNVTAGHSETAPVGGINLTATGTAANTIVFQKSGAGANPIINAFVGTVSMVAGSTSVDGIFSLNGSDYITIDGIDLADGNASAPGTMEYGYGLFKASANDGCQNNTIKNCSITLKASNAATGPGQFDPGSKGIIMTNATRTALGTNLVISSSVGRSDNNTYASNTIKNCYSGIFLRGYGDATFTYLDQNNTVGGVSSSLGNIIENFGGSGTNNTYGIRVFNQNNATVQYNSLNNLASGGSVHTDILYGIFFSATNVTTNANITVKNNTVTLAQGSNNSIVRGIYINANGGTGTTTISNNTVTGCSFVSGASGAFSGIENSNSVCANLIIQNNSVSNNAATTTGTFIGIYNQNNITTSVNISGNSINSNNSSVTVNTFSGILTNAAAASTVTISSNSINSNTISSATTGTFDGISFTTGVSSATLNSNTINNNTLSGTGYLNGINTTGSSSTTLTISSNTISGNQKSGAGGNLYGIRLGGGASTTSSSNYNYIYNNTIPNTSGANSSNNYGLYNASSPSSETYTGNKIYGLSIGGSTTSTSNVYGIYSSTAAATVKSISQDTIYNLSLSISSPTAGSIDGIYNSGGASGSSFSRNQIYNIAGSTSSGITADGIECASGNLVISNNMISNISSTAASAGNAVAGIYISGNNTSTFNVYYNSIYLNATSSGTTFGSSGIFSSSTPTTPTVDLRNNIIINTSVAKGATGKTVAYRRNSTTITYYATTSNNNLFYAGTPSATNLLYYDGTNSFQALDATYYSTVGSRETSSITGTVSLPGSATGDLHTSDATVQNKGQTIATVTTDYDGQNRKPTCGGSDIGADEEYINSSPSTYNLWTGNSNTQWCAVCNWDNEAVPTSSDSVVITTTASNIFYPVLDASCATSNCKGISISGSGSLTIQTGGYLNVYGNFINAATFSNTGGGINFAGTSSQTISSTTDLSFYNLTFSGGGAKSITNFNATVNGTLGLTNGIVTVASGKYISLAAGKTYTGGSSSSFIDGTLRKIFSTAENGTSFKFPIGNGTHYGPIELASIANITDGEYLDASYTVGVAPGDHRNVVTAVPASPSGSTKPVVFSSYVEYWNLSFSNTSSSFAAKLNLWYTDNYFSQLSNKGAEWLRVMWYDKNLGQYADYGNDNVNLDEASGTSGYISSSIALSASLFNNTTFTFGTTANGVNPLPAYVRYFSATKQTGYNKLDWSAGCPGKELTFDVLRSTDGRNFQSVYKFTASQNRCNQPFDFNDYTAAGQKIYYKIKITDEFGKIVYTPVAVIINRINGFEITGLMPNPAADIAYLNISSAVKDKLQLMITDAAGKQVMQVTTVIAAGSNMIPLQIKNLAKGMYSITGVYSSGRTASIKFIKQ